MSGSAWKDKQVEWVFVCGGGETAEHAASEDACVVCCPIGSSKHLLMERNCVWTLAIHKIRFQDG